MSKTEATTPLTYSGLRNKSREWLIDALVMCGKHCEAQDRLLDEAAKRYRKALTTAQRQLMPVRKMLFKTNAQEFKKYGDAINSACNALDVIDDALKVEDEQD